MKKLILSLLLFAAVAFAGVGVFAYPDIPENTREHYLIYTENYRDGRVELALFDLEGSGDEKLIWDGGIEAADGMTYKNDVKYYLDGDEWVLFESGYERISNSAGAVLQSDLDVIDISGNLRLYGQNDDGSLKDFPELVKDWDSVTALTLTSDSELYSRLCKNWIYEAKIGVSEAEEDEGHFIDIDGDTLPDKQKSYKYGDGYVVIAAMPESVTSIMGQTSFHSEIYDNLSRSDVNCTVYFTDADYNIESAVTGNFSSDILGIEKLNIVNKEIYAQLCYKDVENYSEYSKYSIDDTKVCRVTREKIYSVYSTIYSKLLPVKITPNMSVLQLTDNIGESEIMIIDNKEYEIKGEVTERQRDFCTMFYDYYVKPNIGNATDLIEEGDPFAYIYNETNHRVGLVDTVYFSKDYINFVSLPLGISLEHSGNRTPGFLQLDDNFYVYTYAYIAGSSGRSIEMEGVVFSKQMIDEMFEEQIPNEPVYVSYKGNLLSFDTPPRIINDYTMVPLRFLFEQMGAEVEWDDSTQTAVVTYDGITIEVQIGSSTALINGEKAELDAPAVIISDRALLPLRFISENLGYTVNWNDETHLVTIE